MGLFMMFNVKRIYSRNKSEMLHGPLRMVGNFKPVYSKNNSETV
jgi:hypothetical protein